MHYANVFECNAIRYLLLSFSFYLLGLLGQSELTIEASRFAVFLGSLAEKG